jgi:hypothetical protein
MKNIFLIIVSLFLVTSCEKEINLDLEDQSGQIVIEGNVTDQAGPYFVKLQNLWLLRQPINIQPWKMHRLF